MKASKKIIQFKKSSEGNNIILIRYSLYKKGNYIDVIDYTEKEGKIANFIALLFRKDDFAKSIYSFWERFYFYRIKFAAEQLDGIK